MRRLTASKLDLAFDCLHWLTLDYEDEPGAKAQAGTAFHQLVSRGEHSVPLSPPDHRAAVTRFEGWQKHGAKLLPDTFRHEVAYAFRPDGSVLELGEDIDRAYDARGAGPDDICCSVDIVASDRVVDFKTGRAYVSAEESWQLRIASICANVSVGEFHYVSETGRVKVDRAEYAPGQLHADSERLIELAQRRRSRDVAPIYGEHCDARYCPARTVCPRYLHVMGQLVATTAPKTQERKPDMSKFTLKSVTKGPQQAPYFIVLYGPEGIGKSSFAADAPSPIFLGEPGGTDHLDVARFPAPDSLEDIFDAFNSLEKEAHEYQTLVLDTADYLEPVIWDSLCRASKKSSIEDFGYGKGYSLALDKWREIITRLDALRSRKGMHVVVLAHSHLKNVRNPLGDDYEHYELKLHGKAAALLKEAPKAVLFANYVSYTDKDEATKRVKAYGDGSRMLYTEHRPAYDAKNRYGLPEELPLSWDDFDAAAKRGQPKTPEALAADVKELLKSVDEETRSKVAKYLEENRDNARKLAALADRLRGKIREQEAA